MLPEKALILLRGLPGSGKTTLARVLSRGQDPVFSVDDYFTAPDGTYEFRFSENHLAYSQCERSVAEAMSASAPRIFVDNTFTLEWELEPYFRLAQHHGYQVFVATVENRHGHGNVHGIGMEQLKKMAEKYKVVLM